MTTHKRKTRPIWLPPRPHATITIKQLFMKKVYCRWPTKTFPKQYSFRNHFKNWFVSRNNLFISRNKRLTFDITKLLSLAYKWGPGSVVPYPKVLNFYLYCCLHIILNIFMKLAYRVRTLKVFCLLLLVECMCSILY